MKPQPHTGARKGGLLQYLVSFCITFVLAAGLSSPTVNAQVFDSGSDGSDGALDFSGAQSGDTVIFNPATFDPPLDADGDSVYHFTTITVPEGVTVRLVADLLGVAPVTWLASGAVQIDGTLDLNGEDGHNINSVHIPSVAGAGGYGGGFDGSFDRSGARCGARFGRRTTGSS